MTETPPVLQAKIARMRDLLNRIVLVRDKTDGWVSGVCRELDHANKGLSIEVEIAEGGS